MLHRAVPDPVQRLLAHLTVLGPRSEACLPLDPPEREKFAGKHAQFRIARVQKPKRFAHNHKSASRFFTNWLQAKARLLADAQDPPQGASVGDGVRKLVQRGLKLVAVSFQTILGAAFVGAGITWLAGVPPTWGNAVSVITGSSTIKAIFAICAGCFILGLIGLLTEY
jgi:hypothetical protein